MKVSNRKRYTKLHKRKHDIYKKRLAAAIGLKRVIPPGCCVHGVQLTLRKNGKTTLPNGKCLLLQLKCFYTVTFTSVLYKFYIKRSNTP